MAFTAGSVSGFGDVSLNLRSVAASLTTEKVILANEFLQADIKVTSGSGGSTHATQPNAVATNAKSAAAFITTALNGLTGLQAFRRNRISLSTRRPRSERN